MHMANLSQTIASIEANVTQINALLQQLAAKNNQLNLQQQAILQQMAMLSMNPLPAMMARSMSPQPHTSFLPLPFMGANSSTRKWSRNHTSSSINSAGEAEVMAIEVGARTVPGEEEDGANQDSHSTLVGIR